ncbi:MAG: phycobilisome protein [Cyanobacteria bacterium P01_A01_bin.3]
MIDKLNLLFHAAEESYLQDSDLQTFETLIDSLEDRLNLYEKLRDMEEKLAQRLALNLQEGYPSEPPRRLQLALQNHVLIMRYCSMAMLIDDRDFLKYRLLEWLTEVVAAHDLQEIQNSLYRFMQKRLKKFLSSAERELIDPYLQLTKEMMLDQPAPEIALQL